MSLSDQDCTYINKLFIVFIHQCITATYVKMCISCQFPVLRSTMIILMNKNHLYITHKNKTAGCSILQIKRNSKSITLQKKKTKPKTKPNKQN